MIDSKKKKYLYIILSVLLLISIIPLIYISIYSRPSSDDFGYATALYNYIKSGNWNIFGLIKKAIEVDISFYNSWQGLYTSAFVLSLEPGIFGNKYYFIGSILLLILCFICIYYFVKTIFKLLNIKHYIFFSIFIFVFLFQHLPDINQGLYWFNGAWNYMPFLFLSLVNVTLCIKYLFIKENNKYLIFSCLLSFIISGGNHVTSFMNILLLICICSYAIYKKKYKLVLSLIVAIVGFIIMYIAPGTAIRASHFGKHGIISTIITTFIKSLTFMSEYLKDALFYIFAILIFSIFNYDKDNLKDSYFKVSPIIYMFIAWVILCGMYAVPIYVMGGFGEGRITDVVWCYLIIAVTLLTIYSSWYILYKYVRLNDISSDLFINLMFALFVIACAYWMECNYWNISIELIDGKASAFADSYDERIELMNSIDDEIVYVNSLPDSNVLKFEDISNGVNGLWNTYYGVNTAAIDTTWINKNDIDRYISSFKENGKTIIITKDKLETYDENETKEYDISIDNLSIDTNIERFQIVINGNTYEYLLDEKVIKEGNIQELTLFDYYLINIDSNDNYNFELVKIY